jgi:hypothetical protein
VSKPLNTKTKILERQKTANVRVSVKTPKHNNKNIGETKNCQCEGKCQNLLNITTKILERQKTANVRVSVKTS